MTAERCRIIQGDALTELKKLPDCSINCCVTSPPYYALRDYGVEGQIGLVKTPELYIGRLLKVFGEVKRVLADDGTLWLNLGDSYNGSGKAQGQKPEDRNCGKMRQERGYDVPEATNVAGLKSKNLIGVPWRMAFALQADGWYLRQDIIWHKPNPMPESITDRCTKSHEYIFLLSKSKNYYFDHEAIKEPSVESECYKGLRKRYTPLMQMYDPRHQKFSVGENGIRNMSGKTYPMRNKRSVWIVTTKGYPEAHFATYPPDLIEPCILAGCPERGTVLDPFSGAGTTGWVALRNSRNYIGIELNPEYVKITRRRLRPLLSELYLF